jgi:hypothetical protein
MGEHMLPFFIYEKIEQERFWLVVNATFARQSIV